MRNVSLRPSMNVIVSYRGLCLKWLYTMPDQDSFNDLYKFLVVTLDKKLLAQVGDKKFKAIFITIKDS